MLTAPLISPVDRRHLGRAVCPRRRPMPTQRRGSARLQTGPASGEERVHERGRDDRSHGSPTDADRPTLQRRLRSAAGAPLVVGRPICEITRARHDEASLDGACSVRIKEVAERLKLNEQTVRNWIDRGELSAIRLGSRRVRIYATELNRFIAESSAAAKPTRRRLSKGSKLLWNRFVAARATDTPRKP